MNDAVERERARAAWKRGLSWLVAFSRGDFEQRPVEPAPRGFMSRAAAHARLASLCMQEDIIVEYTPGQRLVLDSKLGGIEAMSISPAEAPEHVFLARPVTVDWRGKDAIGWGYDL